MLFYLWLKLRRAEDGITLAYMNIQRRPQLHVNFVARRAEISCAASRASKNTLRRLSS